MLYWRRAGTYKIHQTRSSIRQTYYTYSTFRCNPLAPIHGNVLLMFAIQMILSYSYIDKFLRYTMYSNTTSITSTHNSTLLMFAIQMLVLYLWIPYILGGHTMHSSSNVNSIVHIHKSISSIFAIKMIVTYR